MCADINTKGLSGNARWVAAVGVVVLAVRGSLGRARVQRCHLRLSPSKASVLGYGAAPRTNFRTGSLVVHAPTWWHCCMYLQRLLQRFQQLRI